MPKKVKSKVTKVSIADKNNAVLTITGGNGDYCKIICEQCPWRVDQTGNFPAEAFRLSANTSYDMATHCFACHMAGRDKPTICAGFLLRGADDNLSIRIKKSNGNSLDVKDSGVILHASYKTMAIANGCDTDDPKLEPCMPEARNIRVRRSTHKFFRGVGNSHKKTFRDQFFRDQFL